jgi:hypothetical protein
MTFTMRDYHGHRQELLSSDHAGEWFDEQVESIMPTGTCGQVIWYGPTDGRDELRVDIDIDGDRAALTWLPDASHAVELEPGPTLTVLVSADGDLDVIPAHRARVSVATTRRAIMEYVATGKRPESTHWEEPHPAPRTPQR